MCLFRASRDGSSFKQGWQQRPTSLLLTPPPRPQRVVDVAAGIPDARPAKTRLNYDLARSQGQAPVARSVERFNTTVVSSAARRFRRLLFVRSGGVASCCISQLVRISVGKNVIVGLECSGRHVTRARVQTPSTSCWGNSVERLSASLKVCCCRASITRFRRIAQLLIFILFTWLNFGQVQRLPPPCANSLSHCAWPVLWRVVESCMTSPSIRSKAESTPTLDAADDCLFPKENVLFRSKTNFSDVCNGSSSIFQIFGERLETNGDRVRTRLTGRFPSATRTDTFRELLRVVEKLPALTSNATLRADCYYYYSKAVTQFPLKIRRGTAAKPEVGL